jgi:hypothetical protein
VPSGRDRAALDPERVFDAMLEWRARYGGLPSSYDWSRTSARRRGGDALARLRQGDWPSASVVTSVFGSWANARAAAHGAATRAPDIVCGRRVVRGDPIRAAGPAGPTR